MNRCVTALARLVAKSRRDGLSGAELGHLRGFLAEHNPADDSYDVLANFQGPFSTHPARPASPRSSRLRPAAA